MIVHLIISVVFFLILMYLSVNLLGLLVRGLFTNPEMDTLKQNSHEFIKKEIAKSERTDKWLNIIAFVLILAYLYALFHFWNIGVVACAVIVMIGRMPDLLWEIKHGKKTDPSQMKKDALYYISAFLPWLGLLVLYFSLYGF